MPTHVTVDTNVLLHADNPASGRQTESVALLEKIESEAVKVCIDGAGRILGEYYSQLSGSALARGYLTKWLRENGCFVVDGRPTPPDNRWINLNIGDSLDRTFLKVAVCAPEKRLVSHDFADFPQRKRAMIDERLEVDVLTADAFLAL